MQESKNHHYVPVFYLKRWAKNDGRIYSIKNINGKIAKTRCSPEYSGFEVYLYSYHKDFPSEDRAEIETKFFKPLDTEGARITEKILQGEHLNRRDGILFAQFLAATKVRVPENVALINSQAQQALLRELEAGQEEYARLRPVDGPETLVEWVRLSHPALIESIGIGQLPKIISNTKVLQSILLFKWHVVDLAKSRKALLTSDRPCVFTDGLHKENCIIALPLSPTKAFFAFRAGSVAMKRLMDLDETRLAMYLNQSVVSQAATRAYCHDSEDATESFFRKYLSPTMEE